jgi:hypothetical protein
MKGGVRQTALLLVAVVLGMAGAVLGQGAAPTPQAVLPGGNGAWRVELTTDGGFSGTGSGDITADSSGLLKCTSTKPACPEKLSAVSLRNLTAKVHAAAAVSWQTARSLQTPSLCSDCLTVHLQLTIRMPDGVVRTFITSWDAASGSPADQVLALYKALTSRGSH